MIRALLLAQWADLGTYLLAVSIHPWGESGFLAGLPPAQIVGVKALGVGLVVTGIHFISPRKRWWVLVFGVALGVAGSLTNVVGGLI